MGRHGRGLPWWQPLCLWVGLALLPALAPAGPYLRVDSFTFAGPVSLATALDDWQGPFVGGDEQFTYDWLEAGMTRGAWGLGLLYRYDWSLRFSADTAEYYHRARNDLPVSPGRRWSLHLSAQHFRARGLRLSWRGRPASGLRLHAGLSLLQADGLIDGRIDGTDRAATIDYHYSRDQLFDRPVAAPDGYGLSLDLAFDWQATPRLRVHGEGVDLPGILWWRDAPWTRATANADRELEDSGGIPSLAPLVSGREGSDARWRQRLAPRWLLRGAYTLDAAWDGRLALRQVNGRLRWGLGGARRLGGGVASVDFWPGLGLWQLGWRTPRLTLALGADRTDDALRSLRLHLSLRY